MSGAGAAWSRPLSAVCIFVSLFICEHSPTLIFVSLFIHEQFPTLIFVSLFICEQFPTFIFVSLFICEQFPTLIFVSLFICELGASEEMTSSLWYDLSIPAITTYTILLYYTPRTSFIGLLYYYSSNSSSNNTPLKPLSHKYFTTTVDAKQFEAL